ncbi:MAG: cyclic nucleotide-binding domain-containing protein [Nitriliruptoraceae bacterium]
MTTREPLSSGGGDPVQIALASHPFCDGMEAEHIAMLSRGASERTLATDQYVIRHGHEADALYLVVEGAVALEVSDPTRGPMTIETIHTGDVIGWSWLFPPRSWAFDGRCLTPSRFLRLDGDELRQLIDRHPTLGRDLVLRLGRVVVERLQSARVQLLDVHHVPH